MVPNVPNNPSNPTGKVGKIKNLFWNPEPFHKTWYNKMYDTKTFDKDWLKYPGIKH
jgi:hypothetical protein